MKFTGCPIEGLIIISPAIYRDDRGTFQESYNEQLFKQHGIDFVFVQDNQSVSKKGVIRGLHFQTEPHAQGKLVRVTSGRALDVAVDLREGSPTFGRHYNIELDAVTGVMLWIPPGFAHGFEALEDNTVFAYKVTAPYHKAAEAGIRFDDPDLGIHWQSAHPLISEKDRILPTFREWTGRN